MNNFHHLRKVNQNYIEHFYNSLSYSLTSSKASFCFLVHAIYPDIFTTTGSNLIQNLHQELQKNNKQSLDLQHNIDR